MQENGINKDKTFNFIDSLINPEHKSMRELRIPCTKQQGEDIKKQHPEYTVVYEPITDTAYWVKKLK